MYRVVRTVRSALEGKAHLTLPERVQDTPATPLALTIFTLSKLFKCEISPQVVDNDDF